jgi:hypothetical protein
MTSHKAKYVSLAFRILRRTNTVVSRSFFKKWLDLEKRLGDEEGAAIVKQKAIEWTQKAVNLS